MFSLDSIPPPLPLSSFHLRVFSRRDFVFIDACVDIIDDLIEQTKGDAAEREREVERERGIR